MSSLARHIAVIVLVVVAAAAILSLITFLSPALHDFAGGVAGKFDMGRAGIVLAGVLAPILYLFKNIGEWFARVFLGGLGGSGSAEKAIADRTRELEAQIKQLRQDVSTIEASRAAALQAEHARLAEIEAHLATLRQSMSTVDEQIAHLESSPPPERTHSNEELVDIVKKSPDFIELPVKEETGQP